MSNPGRPEKRSVQHSAIFNKLLAFLLLPLAPTQTFYSPSEFCPHLWLASGPSKPVPWRQKSFLEWRLSAFPSSLIQHKNNFQNQTLLPHPAPSKLKGCLRWYLTSLGSADELFPPIWRHEEKMTSWSIFYGPGFCPSLSPFFLQYPTWGKELKTPGPCTYLDELFLGLIRDNFQNIDGRAVFLRFPMENKNNNPVLIRN